MRTDREFNQWADKLSFLDFLILSFTTVKIMVISLFVEFVYQKIVEKLFKSYQDIFFYKYLLSGKFPYVFWDFISGEDFFKNLVDKDYEYLINNKSIPPDILSRIADEAPPHIWIRFVNHNNSSKEFILNLINKNDAYFNKQLVKIKPEYRKFICIK